MKNLHNQGNFNATLKLAISYFEGKGTERDLIKSKGLFKIVETKYDVRFYVDFIGNEIKLKTSQLRANEKEIMIQILNQKFFLDNQEKEYSTEELLILFQNSSEYDKTIAQKLIKSDLFYLLYFMRLYYNSEKIFVLIQQSLNEKSYKKEQFQDALTKIETLFPEEHINYQKVFKIKKFIEENYKDINKHINEHDLDVS